MQTLWWRAPEVLFGSKEYNEAIDVWSFGIIAQELFAGIDVFNPRGRALTTWPAPSPTLVGRTWKVPNFTNQCLEIGSRTM